MDIRSLIGQSEDEFAQAWTESLKAASEAYAHHLRLIWKKIFDDVFGLSGIEWQESRGLPNDEAIQMYVRTMEEGQSRDLFTSMKRLHSSASMNAEALRKLVKKFDKGAVARGDNLLTPTLIPELYSAQFMGHPALEHHIETLRDLLVVAEDKEEEILEGEEEDAQMNVIRQKTSMTTKDSNDVKRRAEELSWLQDMARSIPSKEMKSLVAHRGMFLQATILMLFNDVVY